MRTLILYSDDFTKHHIWEQVCNAIGADPDFDKITLTVADVEESTQAEDDEEE